MSKAPKTEYKPQVLKDFLLAFLVPTIVNKVFMVYFGIQYANYKDEGYGYGLVATILFLFFTMGRLVWKYRDNPDP
ncbi:MAG: hypothetical protein JNL11_06175 [Bdellovibrionaceae bacterium]|nr:hypothetical protein [Pseudobdellovibrionaceae bacterium]